MLELLLEGSLASTVNRGESRSFRTRPVFSMVPVSQHPSLPPFEFRATPWLIYPRCTSKERGRLRESERCSGRLSLTSEPFPAVPGYQFHNVPQSQCTLSETKRARACRSHQFARSLVFLSHFSFPHYSTRLIRYGAVDFTNLAGNIRSRLSRPGLIFGLPANSTEKKLPLHCTQFLLLK